MKKKENKILGIDYGDFTIGLAIYNEETDFTYPYKTIFRDKANVLRKSLREIVEIIEKENINEIVIGLPLNADATSGERVEKVKTFAKMLETKLIEASEAIGVSEAVVASYKSPSIHFQDERYSTREAREILRDRGIKKSEEKKYIDQVAAEIILNDYIRK